MDWFREDMSQKHEDIDRLPEDMNQVREDMNPKHQDMYCALEGTKTIRDEADALRVLLAAPAGERRGFPVDAKGSRRERGKNNPRQLARGAL